MQVGRFGLRAAGERCVENWVPLHHMEQEDIDAFAASPAGLALAERARQARSQKGKGKRRRTGW